MTFKIEEDIPMPPVKQAPQKPQPAAPRQMMRDDQDRDIRDVPQAPEGLQRQRRGFIDPFDIPQRVLDRYAAAGWSLEWKRHTVYGQSDNNYENSLSENKWEPVTSDEIPGFMPKGYSGAIIREGLMLRKRPAYLTAEARREDNFAAREAIRTKEAQLGQTPPGTMTRDHPTAKPIIGKHYGPIDVPQD